MPTPLGATYYPSCMVNLKIKFDESLHIAATREDPTTYSVNDIVATFKNAQPGIPLSAPLILDGQQPSDGVTLTRVPRSANVEIPAIRKAGTFKLTFDFRDLPIDPRTVRSVGVEIFLDTVRADDFAEGVVQVNPPNGNRASFMSPQKRASFLQPMVENMAMKGLADGWHVSHTSKGSTVTIEGRDLTGMFLNTPITYDLVDKCPLDKPIDEVVNWIIGVLPWGEKVQAMAAPPQLWKNGQVPKLASLKELQLTNPRVRQSANGKKVKASAGANQDKLNFWDLITRYCFLVGAIPSITLKTDMKDASKGFLSTIYIQPATTALDVQRALMAGTLEDSDLAIPFANHNMRNVDGTKIAIRHMVFGRNIEDMQVERRFSGKIPKIVEVISYNPSSKEKGPARLLTARSNAQSYFPELNPNMTIEQKMQVLGQSPIVKDAKPSGRTSVSPRGNRGSEDVLRIPVPGISDPDRLQTLANQLFAEICKGETGGSIKTRSLASFGGDNLDPDMLRMRPGDGVSISVESRALENRAPAVHPLVDQARMSAFEMMKDLQVRLGVDVNLARVIVATMRNMVLELQNTYRVNTVKFDWDVAHGVTVAFDFHNYIEARNNTVASPPLAGAPQQRKQVKVAGGPTP